MSTHEYIAQELQRFLLSAEHSSTRQVLSVLLPREKSTVPVQENALVHLAAEVNKNYQRFCSSNRQKPKLIAEMNLLFMALNDFAQQVVLTKNNEMIHGIAEKAFLASQDLVLEVLHDSQANLKRIKKLTQCLEQTVRVLKNPGKKEDVYQSDRTRKAGGLTVVSIPKGCRRLVQTNFKNDLSHQHR